LKRLLNSLLALVVCLLMVSCSSPGSAPEIVSMELQKISTDSGSVKVAEFKVIASADDANESAVTTLITDTDLRIRSYPEDNPKKRISVGLRFQGVNVPRDATVVASYISIYPITEKANDINCILYVQDTGDAADFLDNPYITDEAFRPRISYYKPWVEDDVNIDAYINSPSLNAPLQELFNKVNWSAGNDLVILMIANTDVEKYIRFWHSEKWLDLPPKLHIEYLD
jgi:hypothetical protein